MRAWEPEAKQKSELDDYYEVGIVLTGMLSYDDYYNRINFKASSDRIWQAVELYREKRIGKIFITGGSGEIFNQNNKEAEILKTYLVKLGINEDDIYTENDSRNTYENAKESAKILKPETHKRKYLLISSAYHMRRSSACFAAQGFWFDTYVTDRYCGKRKFTPDQFIPKAETLQNWKVLCKELVGFAIYDVSGKF